MSKQYTALGLMSGTSGDGVDASIIRSDGKTSYEVISNKYFQYTNDIYQGIHSLKEKIHTIEDLSTYSKNINSLEKDITLFHAQSTNDFCKNKEVDLVGFHGQTIYHNPKEKISKQIGNGALLSQLTKKKIVYDFRQNDIRNGGEGAPLTPIFHQLILKQNKIDVPSCILNIGGISNITIVKDYNAYNFKSSDIGPGNCLIDLWVRKNSNSKFDKDGQLASTGKCNEIILEQAQELFLNRPNHKNKSFDVNDFDVSFARGLSLEDGAATLTDFTGGIIGAALFSFFPVDKNKFFKVIICGGGRKNKSLINKIKQRTNKNLIFESIDDYGIDGDYVESQAFAYLAIRSFLGEPISFPDTTGCSKPLTGGSIFKFK